MGTGKNRYFGLSFVLLLVMTVLFGCSDGKDGAAGAPGPHGSYASSDCLDCHHLNDLAVNEFTEIFVSGLAGADKVVTAGTATTLSFVASKLPAGEVAKSYLWTRTSGLNAATSSLTASSLTVTMPVSPNYKQELVRHVKGLLVTELDGTVVADRTKIVPINPFNFEEAFSSIFKLRVATTSGKFYYTLVKITDSTGQTAVEGFAAPGTGINTVPIGVPVLLRAATAGSYNWALSVRPGGSTAVMRDATTQIADFTPDVAGLYTVTVGAASLNIYAGTWRGVITGQNASGRPVADSACTGCHSAAGSAPDKFTPWSNSGHAEILTQNINDPAGHWTVAGCGPCHTVGFDLLAVNGGFDEFSSLTTTGTSTIWAFSGHGGPSEWSHMLANYPNTAKLANIQCENCHGPQDGTTSHATSAVSNTTTGGPRTSMSADVCGVCHGEPPRHSRFQQWEDSGHGNHELAVAEGTSGGNVNGNCGGCHSGQGFIRWLKELQSGDPLRSVTSFSLSVDEVVPLTCQTCHDPHIQGTLSGEPNSANLRITDNTPKLPGGFQATGVGRGAICIVCHNSRNGGGSGSLAADSWLHQDGDPQFGNLTSYSGPHEANQGDMLMGYNAYFMGSGNYRSPHSLIIDTCTNCHMEHTPPPPLLSYNLGGTNHSFKASMSICTSCHGVNNGIGGMLQSRVRSGLEHLEKAIGDLIVSRNTATDIRWTGRDCTIASVVDLGSRGSIGVLATGTTCTAGPTERISVSLSNLPGIRICTTTVTPDCLDTDNLAKALWNFYLVEQDQSFGVHNPDFTIAVMGASQSAVESIPTDFIPSNELKARLK